MDNDDNEPVPDKLCQARMQTLVERIEGLKKTIVATATAMTTVIIAFQFILTLVKG